MFSIPAFPSSSPLTSAFLTRGGRQIMLTVAVSVNI